MQVYMTDSTRNQLAAICAATGETMSGVIRRLVADEHRTVIVAQANPEMSPLIVAAIEQTKNQPAA